MFIDLKFSYCSLCMCVAMFSALSNAKADYGFGFQAQDPFHQRDRELTSSLVESEHLSLNARNFFATVTLTLATSVSTYTQTTTTTCSTSTTAIKICSPSKGRRRRQNFGIHRLMFEEEEFDERSIFANPASKNYE